MLYEESAHPVVKVGQVWGSAPSGETALIVAIDSWPGGFVVNVVLEDGRDINGVRQVLAPIAWAQLEAHLGKVISEHADVSMHLSSYLEWKEMAQAGKAGFWKCSPAKVLATVREGAGG